MLDLTKLSDRRLFIRMFGGLRVPYNIHNKIGYTERIVTGVAPGGQLITGVIADEIFGGWSVEGRHHSEYMWCDRVNWKKMRHWNAAIGHDTIRELLRIRKRDKYRKL